MTSIDIPRDDLGTLDLKLKKASFEAVKPTGAVLPYPSIGQENQIREIIREQFRPKQQRRKQERRQGDRRYHKEPVLLDTRSHHDRRLQGRRRSDEHHHQDEHSISTETSLIKKGIDTYA